MLDIGVIGAGAHSTTNHGPALRACRDHAPSQVTLAAVCDRARSAAREYADEHGFAAVYDDIDAMLGTECLDALVTVTPVASTRSIVTNLLPAGIPVLIEKPPGETPGDARALGSVAREHGTPTMVSMNRRFSPAVGRLESWLGGLPDDLRTCAGGGILSRTGRTEPAFVTNTGIHCLDTLAALIGPPRRLTAHRWRDRNGKQAAGHFALAHLQCQQAVGTVRIASDAGRRREGYWITGRGFTGSVDVQAATCRGWHGGECVFEWALSADAPRYVRNGTLRETKAFLAAVRGERPFEPTIEDVLPGFHAATALDAGNSGRLDWEDVPDARSGPDTE